MISPSFDRAEIRRIAAAYPKEAHAVSAWERERYFTPLQQAAWLLRFQPEAAAEMAEAQP